jgi:RES domain-containing protein
VTSVFRLSSPRFPANSGLGAALYGGRWNRIGTEAIYASESRSLAALEILVHFSVLPKDFVLSEIDIPDELSILRLGISDLTAGWDSEAVVEATQDIGERWTREGRYAVLSVPSTIVPAERNFVINPSHPEFPAIRFSPPSAGWPRSGHNTTPTATKRGAPYLSGCNPPDVGGSTLPSSVFDALPHNHGLAAQ